MAGSLEQLCVSLRHVVVRRGLGLGQRWVASCSVRAVFGCVVVWLCGCVVLCCGIVVFVFRRRDNQVEREKMKPCAILPNPINAVGIMPCHSIILVS